MILPGAVQPESIWKFTSLFDWPDLDFLAPVAILMARERGIFILIFFRFMTFEPDFLKKIEEKLLAEKEKLEHQLSELSVPTSPGQETSFPDYGEQSGENAAEVASFDSDLSLKNVLNDTLRDIDSSLKRLADGTYGICKYCGNEISRERLEIRPTSSSCVDCKKKFSN